MSKIQNVIISKKDRYYLLGTEKIRDGYFIYHTDKIGCIYIPNSEMTGKIIDILNLRDFPCLNDELTKIIKEVDKNEKY